MIELSEVVSDAELVLDEMLNTRNNFDVRDCFIDWPGYLLAYPLHKDVRRFEQSTEKIRRQNGPRRYADGF